MGITAVWRIAPWVNTAMSVVPPPISTRHTPKSFSSSDTTAPADTTPAAGLDVKAAVVYLGVPDDKGWTYQHEQGIAAAEQELGIEIKRVENVLDNADSEKVFEQLAGEVQVEAVVLAADDAEPAHKHH